MSTLLIAAKLVRRDIKAGEVWLFLLSLFIAITCISSIHMFTDRIKRAIQSEASTLLGGDIVLISNRPVSQSILNSAQDNGLTSTQTTSFFSMVRAKEQLVLADIKAIQKPYPLRGKLKVASQPFAQGQVTTDLPQSGSLWVQSRILPQLGLHLGDKLTIGETQLTITKVLSYEPDQAGSWFAIAPRILMNQNDVPKTNIIQPGSRVSYRLLLTGAQSNLDRFIKQIKPNLQPGQRLLDAKLDRPAISQVLSRTNHYLNLAGVVAVILAGISIALASQKYCQRHQNTVALMRCFGTPMPTILTIFTTGLLLMCLLSILSGIIFGLGFQMLLEVLFAGLINFQLPPAHISASFPAAIIGLLLLFGFALPQLMRLKNVSSTQLLGRSQTRLPLQNPLVYGAAMLAVCVILFWQTADLQLLIILLVAFSISIAMMYLLATLLISLLNKIQRHFSSAWRMGLLNVVRHQSNSVLHITAFGTTFLVVLLLGMIRTNLTVNWQQDLPPNTPNYFVINISPTKAQLLQTFLSTNTITSEPLYPMIRGRLTTRNGQPIKETLNTAQQQVRALYRDLNFTYRKDLVVTNTLVKGQWWPTDITEPLVSLEEGFANSLGLQIGEQIGVVVAGQEVNARIFNIRKVSWGSFKPNFFMIFTPGVLENFPQTYMTSFYLPPKRTALLNNLIKQFPNITIIDIADIIKNVQSIVGHMSLAISYILSFMLLIGLLVLVASIVANIEQRAHESAIMRAQGATSGQIRTTLIAEFVCLGALAGFAAGICAVFCSWVLSYGLFNMPFQVTLWPLWVSPIVSSVLIAITGFLGSLPVLRSSPMKLLKTF